MTFYRFLHRRFLATKRADRLAQLLAGQIPPGDRVLDVGCGDGRIPRRLGELRLDLEVRGLEVLVRPDAALTVERFDGRSIPYPDASFGSVIFVDVLHHTPDPMGLLREGRRVARRSLLIKDHCRTGWLAQSTLRVMDRVGNDPGHVDFYDTYWTAERWQRSFEQLGLRVVCWNDRLNLFPAPADWIFGRRLHFLARLEVG
jgi:SAM-dependent methyltransferase